jgi:hypothetical protein
MASSWEEERTRLILQELETKTMVSYWEEERSTSFTGVSSWEEERMHLISGVKDHGDG